MNFAPKFCRSLVSRCIIAACLSFLPVLLCTSQFHARKWCNVLEFRPQQTRLLKNDFDNFTIGVKPEDNVEEIIVQWKLLSRDYQKDGKLTIPVKPRFEDNERIIYVDTPDELKPNEEIIEPKIVEE